MNNEILLEEKNEMKEMNNQQKQQGSEIEKVTQNQQEQGEKTEEEKVENLKIIKRKFHEIGCNLVEKVMPDKNNLLTLLQKQIEYYFGDTNLKNDKFLKDLIQKNEEGYVDIDQFLKFNRIKKFLGKNHSFKEKITKIVCAIKQSEILKLNNTNSKVQRIVNFNYQNQSDHFQVDETNKKSIYVENIPPKITLEQLAQIFQEAGSIINITLPKNKNKLSKGFAFIEFLNASEAQQAKNLFHQCVPSLIMQDSNFQHEPFKVLLKTEWIQSKKQFQEIKKKLKFNIEQNPNSSNYNNNNKNKINTQQNYNQSDSFLQYQEILQMNNHNETLQNNLQNQQNIQKNNFKEVKVFIERNCIAKISNINEITFKENLDVWIRQIIEPAYIDFKDKNKVGYVRFKSEKDLFYFLNSDRLQNDLDGNTLVIEQLHDKEEERYWNKIEIQKNNQRKYLLEKKYTKQHNKTH